MKEHFDAIGNSIEIGDEVLIVVPKSNASYRRGFIKDFKNEYNDRCEVLVEYDDGRLYCNKSWHRFQNGDSLEFKSKPIKVWRFSNNVIKFKSEYLNKEL